MNYRGDEVHGEIDSEDASGGVSVKFYDPDSTTERALSSTEYFNLTDILFISTVGGAYSLSMGAAAAGKYMVKGNADALGGLAHHFQTPIACLRGVTPLFTAALGQVDVILSGFVTRS